VRRGLGARAHVGRRRGTKSHRRDSVPNARLRGTPLQSTLLPRVGRGTLALAFDSVGLVFWTLERELAAGCHLLRTLETATSPHTARSLSNAALWAAKQTWNAMTALPRAASRSFAGALQVKISPAKTQVSVDRAEGLASVSPGQGLIVQLPGPLRPGQTAERWIDIQNAAARPARISFVSSGLSAATGWRIPAHFLRFDPTSLSVPAGDVGRVLVRLTIPQGTPDGIYEGHLQFLGARVEGSVVRTSVRSKERRSHLHAGT
jgi:hypothetical protein